MNLFGTNDEIHTYLEAMENPYTAGTPVERIRFVVLDTETTGLDPAKDAIVSIGAIAVSAGSICLDDQFEALLRFSHNTSSVVVHGVTREAAMAEGVDDVIALKTLLAYLRNGVIVGHHVGFDVDILSAHCRRRFGIGLDNPWLDTMELTLHLEDTGILPQPKTSGKRDYSLDGLCQRFGIPPHDRHTAAGDAFITAQLFLKLLRLAARSGRRTLGTLAERYTPPATSSTDQP